MRTPQPHRQPPTLAGAQRRGRRRDRAVVALVSAPREPDAGRHDRCAGAGRRHRRGRAVGVLLEAVTQRPDACRRLLGFGDRVGQRSPGRDVQRTHPLQLARGHPERPRRLDDEGEMLAVLRELRQVVDDADELDVAALPRGGERVREASVRAPARIGEAGGRHGNAEAHTPSTARGDKQHEQRGRADQCIRIPGPQRLLLQLPGHAADPGQRRSRAPPGAGGVRWSDSAVVVHELIVGTSSKGRPAPIAAFRPRLPRFVS